MTAPNFMRASPKPVRTPIWRICDSVCATGTLASASGISTERTVSSLRAQRFW
ncbi:hypothetical protein HK414_06885 [Ramlibacter terrae]|uniref:Uncharacterized protein n=1 Tax=Ramlibacter terrae TaxID=2732511 RepID=A0ABX6P395_9BURK|nr:hypothetical protein HK414_06885 [Ramlibacter terrae]